MTTVTFTLFADTKLDDLEAASPVLRHYSGAIRDDVNDYANVMFFSAAGRAAIETNGGTVWTDAASAEDAIRRYREDDIAN